MRLKRLALIAALSVVARPGPTRAQALSDSILGAPRLASETARIPSEIDLASLRSLFKYQVVARVYRGGRAYMVQNPKITLPGFAHGRVIEPSHVRADEVPATIPWSEVDSLLLRRTHATRIGTGFALTLGILGGLAGYNLGNRAGSDVGPVAALVVGAGAGGIGFLAGGFLGGFAQYWVQVYPERTAEPGWQSSRKQREQR